MIAVMSWTEPVAVSGASRAEPAIENQRTDEALRVLGLGERLNTVIPPAREIGA
jgi:hypothetical protein